MGFTTYETSGAIKVSDITAAQVGAANTFTAAGNNFDEILAVDKGLQFPAVQVASAGANVLDDYEEGSWDPTITGSGGASGQVYGTQIGRYVKIGKLVVCQFRLDLTTLGTVTGELQVGNLPFVIENIASNRATAVFGNFLNFTTAVTGLFGEGDNNTSAVTLKYTAGVQTSTTTAVQATLSNTTRLIGKIYYRTDN